MSEPESLILQILRDMRAQFGNVRSDISQLRSDIGEIRADFAAW